MKKRLIHIPAYYMLIIAALLLSACGSGNGQAAGQGQNARGGQGGAGNRAGQPVAVPTTRVERISIQRQVDLSGTLASLDQVRVSSEASGVIQSVNAELGQEVRAGQVLIQIDPRELELGVVRAESALRQTEAQLGINSSQASVVPPDDEIASVRTATANWDDARAQLARAQELVSKGLLPQAELDTTATRLKITEAALQSALENVRSLKASLQDRRAAYELAQKELNDASIRAPVSGAIAERLVQRGESLREGTQVLTIVQINPLKLQTAVQEKYANVIRPNLEVQFRVETFPDEMFTGRIANISPSINQQSRTFPIEILVENSSRRLRPGFFAKGAILTNMDEDVMAIPQSALSVLAGVSSVYVIENGVVRQQVVTLGAQKDNYYEVLTGLEGGELLAAGNLNQIVTGSRVITDEEEGATSLSPPPASGAPEARGRRGNGAPKGGTE